jgi:uroporphyrinogen-III synthase
MEAVEDFVEELHGRRVLPDLRAAAIGSATARNGARRRARARA